MTREIAPEVLERGSWAVYDALADHPLRLQRYQEFLTLMMPSRDEVDHEMWSMRRFSHETVRAIKDSSAYHKLMRYENLKKPVREPISARQFIDLWLMDEGEYLNETVWDLGDYGVCLQSANGSAMGRDWVQDRPVTLNEIAVIHTVTMAPFEWDVMTLAEYAHTTARFSTVWRNLRYGMRPDPNLLTRFRERALPDEAVSWGFVLTARFGITDYSKMPVEYPFDVGYPYIEAGIKPNNVGRYIDDGVDSALAASLEGLG
jgi:hypothetical protein